MPLEDFKRPNHPDFQTSSELKSMGWSGIRNNSLTDEREVWVNGQCVLTMSNAMCSMMPQAWDKAYADVFSLNEVETK
jgi:hypothetical protein